MSLNDENEKTNSRKTLLDKTDLSVKEKEDKDLALMFDLSKKKKKKKKVKKDKKRETEESTIVDSNNEESDYTYEQLLSRLMKKVYENNPELIEKKKSIMPPPQLMRIGTKKTLWANFQETCQAMSRDPDHVFRFFMTELGTEGSFDGNKRLVIRGKYMPKYIESLLRKYIFEYIKCQMCRSVNTVLTRDSTSRLYFVNCQDCNSSRSVTQIRTGFHATTRKDRRALRK